VKKSEGAPDLVLFGNGSEVATLVDAANKIGSRLKIQIVSVISEGLFKEQSDEYRQLVLPFGIPSLGLTSGLPATLAGLAGPFGKVIGMERFGASAPFKVLDEKFGYTADNIAKQIDIYLGEYKETLAKVKKFC
jgi:transketolase